ncbi:MAG: PKD domain-containing protein [Bacteroidales bacterium]|nr:PKD domain-containing protein [Bacteroidales bacterium]
MKIFYKFLLLILLTPLFVMPLCANAQKIKIADGNNEFTLTQADDQSLHFHNKLSSFSTHEITTKSGLFTQLNLQGYNYSTELGAPMLPVLKSLIEVPYDADFEIKFSNIIDETIQLSDHNVSTPVIPAQPSVSKSENVEDLPFIIDNDIYATDDWCGQELARVVDLGEMRGVRMARLEIAPFMYNPVSGELRVAVSFDCEIKFKGAQTNRTETEKARVYSPWFEASFLQLINHQKPEIFTDGGDALIEVAPVTYIIVSDPMFEASLQPFIQWKTKKGFRVVEAYTNDPAVGTTTTSIKAYLKNFYQNPPDGYHPQSFVLIVGDVAQIPAFNGTAGSHVTDLYYCEYTNDKLPECFYGRFSAINLSQLQAQIDKTLEYEQYAFPDPSFLDEVVMAAGADSYHQLTWGNGQINYGTQYYFNAAHGLYSHTYLQPEPTGGNYSANIRQNVSDGVAYANYSAHCSPSGWADPSFVISHISALTNSHRYPLMVGNCCSSVEFQTTCFGEEILRAPLKGAIGYIGGSNSTYWDEDFWWGVGLETISTNPVYNSSHLGAYDRTFHDRTGITTNDWFITQGQMPLAGNLAVTQSGSSLQNYYWEIYHLMGDPSLMVYFSQPPDMNVSYPDLMPPGTETFIINTEPYAYVAISMNGVLYGAALANSTGVAEVEMTPINEPGEADVVITGQNLKPFIGTVLVSSPDGPHIALESIQIDDSSGNGNGMADYGETISLDITMENIGNQPGNNLTLTLSSQSESITITQPDANIVSIPAGGSVSVNDAFTLTISGDIPDQESINFDISTSDGANTWSGSFNIIGQAPVLQFSDYSLSDPLGNSNGLLDPGETVTISVEFANTGSAEAFEVSGELSTSSIYVSMLSVEPQLFGNILPGGSASAYFDIYCLESTPAGQNISFNVDISADFGISGYQSFSLVAGQIPVLVIDLDENTNSANEIVSAITSLGVAAEYSAGFPADPSLYSSLFVCLGIYSDNHQLSTSEGQILANFLNAGGNLYMEGGDTWAYDAQTPVHSLFGINGTHDGSGDMGTLLGVNGTMTEAMTLTYSGDNSWMDHLEAVNGGTLILNNQSPLYGCGVVNEQPAYKTIGVSFEFGGLSADRTTLMEQYLIFFNLIHPLTADFTAEPVNISPGENVQFTNTSLGNIISCNWVFDGGTPSVSILENPQITYDTPGVYDVTLTVSDGLSNASVSRTGLISVISSGMSQNIAVAQGWSGISACLIPENTDFNAIMQSNIDNVVIMQSMNGVFYPEMQINTIGDWNYLTGYLIKAENPFNLVLYGEELSNRQLTLTQGWNLMPVLSDCPVTIGTLFGLVLNKVSVIKSIAGTEVFWPVYNINTIGSVQPGNAYYIFVTEEIVINFPDCN